MIAQRDNFPTIKNLFFQPRSAPPKSESAKSAASAATLPNSSLPNSDDRSLHTNHTNLLQPLQQTIPVTFTYQVQFTNGVFNLDNPLLAQVISDRASNSHDHPPQKVLAVIDRGLLEHWSDLPAQLAAYAQKYSDVLMLSAEPIVVPGGEDSKNDRHFIDQIHQAINQANIGRHSYIMAIGGGAVLDMVGYAAATAHRGVRLIRVPTTVLAQNSSSIGIKNSINAFGKKNFLGTFAPPYAVINDFDFLTTLDDRDWRAGIATAIKIALIKDRNLFEFICQNATALANRDMAAMQQLIYRCAKLHLDHIATSGDPFEQQSSRLDFGHWAAHKLEQLTSYELKHGEALAIGIALDTIYSRLAGFLSYYECFRILNTLQMLGFILYVPELLQHWQHPHHPDSIFAGLNELREHQGGQLKITLLQSIGCGIEVDAIDRQVYAQAICQLETTSPYPTALDYCI
jgi:3-dehydroquinate synthase